MIMQTIYKVLIVSIVLFVTSTAEANDFCITTKGSNFGLTFVAKDFRLPKPGECVSLIGFCDKGCSPENVLYGVSCAGSQGSHIAFAWTIHYVGGGNYEMDNSLLSLPALKGSGTGVFYQNLPGPKQNISLSSYSAQAAYCTTQPVF
jgi:hypothetical protein